MPQLLIRDVEKEVLEALRRRAAQNGRSVEAEHREILRQALATPSRSFKEMLLSMPNVGEDLDFERQP